MVKETEVKLSSESFAHPLLDKLSDLAYEHCHLRFLVVYPNEDGWGNALPGTPCDLPDFCQLVQTQKEGAKHCRMCHVLMSIAACSQGTTVQKCHAGASVLVLPVSDMDGENISVLSSCVFSHDGKRDEEWTHIQEMGEKLGLDLRKLKKAYNSLPVLDEETIKCGRTMLELAAEAVKEIRRRLVCEHALANGGSEGRSKAGVQKEVRDVLRHSLSGEGVRSRMGGDGKRRNTPLVISVVSDLVAKKPNMPYSVADIATAARMTPNHFSSLFHEHQKQCFSDYLTEKRMELARELLQDLTLNITEVAMKCGYDDPGYFARRFRQWNGVSPREWREQLADKSS